jgi:hypothetical protein
MLSATSANINYHVKADPLAYFSHMIYLSRAIEGMAGRVLRIFPCSKLIPGHILLDTEAVRALLIDKPLINDRKQQLGLEGPITKASLIRDGGVSANSDLIWQLAFKYDAKHLNDRNKSHPVFAGNNDGCNFAYMLRTNGVSASVLWRNP